MMRMTHHRLLPLLLAAAALAAGCKVTPPEPTPAGNPCESNPCNQPHRTTCVAEGSQARCVCDPGYLPRPTGMCVAVDAANCPSHPGDTAEPDDCLANAKTLSEKDGPRSQSIDPAGDLDFFAVDAQEGRIYEVTVRADEGSTLAPRVDLYDVSGTHRDWREGPREAGLGFKALASVRYYVRVSHSPVDPSVGTGAYTLTLVDRGPDDHGDSKEDATTVAPDTQGTPNPVTHTGRFELASDQDWFTFSADASFRYLLSFDPARTRPVVKVIDANGEEAFWEPGKPLPLDVSGKTYLVLYPPQDARIPADYAFTLTSGPF